MLWLYLHFPQLLLDHYDRCHETAPPTAIVDGHPPAIAQANTPARALGVARGQSIHTAQYLAPEICLRPLNPEATTRILKERAQWAYGYTDRITLEPPDGLLLEVSGVLRLHGGLPPLYQHLRDALVQDGFTVAASTGDTPGLARALARQWRELCTQDAETLAHQRRQLPVTGCGFDDAVSQRLERMGLRTLGDLAGLPRAGLARRLGPEAYTQLQKLCGERPDPQPEYVPPARFYRRLDLLREAEQVTSLLFPLQRMLGELTDFLRLQQQLTDTLEIHFLHREQTASPLRLRSTRPLNDHEQFMELLRLRLERYSLTAPVTALTLECSRLLAMEAPAEDLFGTPTHHAAQLKDLLGRLQARLGPQAVHYLTTAADHRPEKAWHALAPQKPPRGLQSAISERPLWLLSTPRPLLEHPQHWLAGPERIQGGWWDGERVRRDYYIAVLASGARAWVFRSPDEGWFIHGWFA
ncbi:DNA polymerase Y family protein [Marinobacteraceae bacterium S3BR75-40.1]